MDNDQTCIETSLGEGEELVRFGNLDLFFQGHTSTYMVSVLYLLNQLMEFDQTGIDTLLVEGKELIKFW